MLDIRQQDNGDVLLDEDIERIEPTDQHKRDILLMAQGDTKESPTIGVNLMQYLHDDDAEEMLRDVRIQCEADGMRISEVSYTPTGDLTITGEYDNKNN